MDDGNVILIAPTANQDGSQTYYILDPCLSTEDTDEPSGIEIIDLTAEVKNTGAIAVLSKNSNTGELELTVTKKGDQIKVENMDQTDTVSVGDVNPDQEPVQNEIEDDSVIKIELSETNQDELKLDQLYDLPESRKTEPRSEEDPLLVVQEPQQNDTEQDDDVEEGTLYIDDNKCEVLEEQEQENPISNNIPATNEENNQTVSCNGEEILVENHDSVSKDSNEASNSEEISNNQVQTVKEQSNNDMVKMEEEDSTCENSITSESENYTFLQGNLVRIPSNFDGRGDQHSSDLSVESTNTALTLLELAGGSSRNSAEQVSLEMEISRMEGSLITIEDHQEPELTTLTTLQPVPLQPSIESSEYNEMTVSDNSTNRTEISASSASLPEQYTPTVTGGPKTKVSNELVQRLLESEETSRRAQYRHLPRPSVSKSEIAQEIYERARQKYPYSEESEKDVFFAMKIAHRLASKIVSPEKSGESEKTSAEKSSLTVNRQVTPMIKKDCLKYKEENTPLPQKKDAISDKIELLKILEDDPDDPGSETSESPSLIEKKPKVKVSRPRAPLLKLHPELEKELALQQLQNFSTPRKKVDFVPEVLKKVDVQGRGRPRKNPEHNNNSQTDIAKRKMDDSSTTPNKKLKNEEVVAAPTADPTQITETLIVEGHDLVEEQAKDGKSIKQYSNKRLSRNSETPPRDVPIEILLNGVEGDTEDLEDKNLSKNKIFKSTNTKKRQEELKKKHIANVLQRNKPHKKRGRPPKKKPVPTDDMLNQEFLMKVINEQSKSTEGKGEMDGKSAVEDNNLSIDEKPLKTKKMREIERLLGDEGAINMLYSVEQKRQTGGEPKRTVLPSYRRKKKDLMLKTKLVKSAVLRLSASPGQSSGRISLRGQGIKDGEDEQHGDEVNLRKMSVDSRDSHQSFSSPLAETFSFPAKIVPAEASRIIRRHSSSSNYSSRSNSPRRLSVDGERQNITSPDGAVLETGQGEDVALQNSANNVKNTTTTPILKPEVSNKICEINGSQSNKNTVSDNNEVHFQQPKISVETKKTVVKTPVSAKLKSDVPGEEKIIRRPGRPRKRISLEEIKKTTELNTSLAAAVNEFTKENHHDKNIPKTTPKSTRSGDSGSSSKIAVYGKRKKGVRTSVVYHEVTLRRHTHLVEITLDPVSSKIKNGFNTNVMKELMSVLTGLVKDENCRVVLIRSEGEIFSQGVDFTALVQPSAEQRLTVAQEMAFTIKELIKSLSSFPKPIIAAVQGPAVGLGTTLLPLCDLVIATSEATFHTPYGKLGQVPEGAASLTLPALLGFAAASELLFVGRKLSAVEAQQMGLVARILPAETFQEDLMSIVTAMASQSYQAMSATKALLRHNMLTSLETTLVSETHLLVQHWTSDECQANFSQYLESGGQGDPAFVFTQPTSG